MKKKILFLSYTDFLGGAAIATYNMFRSISKKNFNLELYCIKKIKINNNNIKKLKISLSSYFRILISIIISQFLFIIFRSKHRVKRSMCVFNTGLLKGVDFKNIDIVHFHWLYNEVVSIDEILKIKNKTIISLHDLWFCNGSFHYNPGDLNYLTKFFENFLLKRKCVKILDSKNKVFTTPSEWCKNEFVNTLKKNNPKNKKLPKIFVIKNVVNFQNFIDKKKFKQINIIPVSEFVLLFHYEKNNDYVKGYDYLFKILDTLNRKMTYKYFIIFGNNTKNFPYERFENLIFYDFGFVDNKKINKVYKLSDALILTSRQETFSQLAADCLRNKTPVIAFNCSGHKELISHKKNGFLAKKFIINDMLKGIDFFSQITKKSFINSNNLQDCSLDSYYPRYLKKIYEAKNFDI